jgi:hypothetical protein
MISVRIRKEESEEYKNDTPYKGCAQKGDTKLFCTGHTGQERRSQLGEYKERRSQLRAFKRKEITKREIQRKRPHQREGDTKEDATKRGIQRKENKENTKHVRKCFKWVENTRRSGGKRWDTYEIEEQVEIYRVISHS